MTIGESPAHDVVRHIVARIPGITATTATPPTIRVGDLFPEATGASALAILCRNFPGEGDTPFVEGGNGHREERPEVQVRVRGDKDDPRTAEALLEAIAAVIVGQARASNVSGYFDAKLRGSGLQSTGPDGEGFPGFVASFGLRRDARRQPIYTGRGVPAAVDAAFILALGTPTTLGTRRTSIWSATAAAGEALWWAAPSDWMGGTPGFFDGLTGRTAIAFTLAGTANLSLDGSTVAYSAWRSTALALGAKTIKTL